MDEFRAEGRGVAGDHSENRSTTSAIGKDAWSSDEAFRALAEEVRAQRLEETPRPAGYVPTTELWWVDDAEVLGLVRHPPSADASPPGGAGPHRRPGPGIRPGAEADATAMLREALGASRGGSGRAVPS